MAYKSKSRRMAVLLCHGPLVTSVSRFTSSRLAKLHQALHSPLSSLGLTKHRAVSHPVYQL